LSKLIDSSNIISKSSKNTQICSPKSKTRTPELSSLTMNFITSVKTLMIKTTNSQRSKELLSTLNGNNDNLLYYQMQRPQTQSTELRWTTLISSLAKTVI
jgi:hypothetical protein